MPRAPSTAEIVNSGRRYPAEDGGYPNDGRNPNNGRNPNDGRYPNNPPAGTVGLPSSRYQTYSELGVLRVKVPDNWRELRESDSSVWFVPEGAYGQVGGQQVFTHGMNFSVVHAQGQGLRAANDQMVSSLLQSNRSMRQIGLSKGSNTGTRYWMSSEFTNVNEATGRRETIALAATLLRNGDVLFISTVVPQNDAGRFQNTFANILNSAQIND